jgi:D-alanine-D-alanine ligase-like ATP-grasp enzyme
MKPGGYSDSGGDIAYALKQTGISVITPSDNPNIDSDLDWVFPDTPKGIQDARERGANVLWLNTVLFAGHPIETALKDGVSVVGQDPNIVDKFDDKIVTNDLLKRNLLPIPDSLIITSDNLNDVNIPFSFPVILKPVRGRGSQGVTLMKNTSDLTKQITKLFSDDKYGTTLYVEPYLPGDEITITVMPPGDYAINGNRIAFSNYWSLPPVKRINHQNGIAPYNGTIAVINNSIVMTDNELATDKVKHVCEQCELAAKLVMAKAPIRIDCRADTAGDFFLFDLNMKPNMTGPSRPHRLDQDSLSALAARKIGWTFTDLLFNMLEQRWSLKS